MLKDFSLMYIGISYRELWLIFLYVTIVTGIFSNLAVLEKVIGEVMGDGNSILLPFQLYVISL